MSIIAHSSKKSRHPFAAPFSQKRIRGMTNGERRGPFAPRKQASSLSGQEQTGLVMDRVGREVCLECGVPKEDGDFCAACLMGFPKTIDLGESSEMLALNGWRYIAVQHRPAIPGQGAFTVMREGIFEYKNKAPRPICFCDSLEEAKAAARKAYDRALGASGGW